MNRGTLQVHLHTDFAITLLRNNPAVDQVRSVKEAWQENLTLDQSAGSGALKKLLRMDSDTEALVTCCVLNEKE
jgi:hypothetical protein